MSTLSSTEKRGSATRILLSAGLVIATLAAITLSSFAADQALVVHLALDRPSRELSLDPYGYLLGILTLALLSWAAASLVGRHRNRRALAGWLIGVSSASALSFAGVALLSAGFFTGARGMESDEAVATTVLFVIADISPSIASLGASILVFVAGTRPVPRFVPPLATVAISAIAIAIVYLAS